MKIKPPDEQTEFEKAIILLVDCVKEYCNNDKPLILHSLRVGFKLWEFEQPNEIIIAGFLHDLLEDTNCKIEKIKEKFGDRIAKLVLACTLLNIKNDEERWLMFLGQIKKAGKEVIIIKIADAYDNLSFVVLIKDRDYLKKILWKHKMIIEKLGPEVKDAKIFKEYSENYKKIIKQYGIKD